MIIISICWTGEEKMQLLQYSHTLIMCLQPRLSITCMDHFNSQIWARYESYPKVHWAARARDFRGARKRIVRITWQVIELREQRHSARRVQTDGQSHGSGHLTRTAVGRMRNGACSRLHFTCERLQLKDPCGRRVSGVAQREYQDLFKPINAVFLNSDFFLCGNAFLIPVTTFESCNPTEMKKDQQEWRCV